MITGRGLLAACAVAVMLAGCVNRAAPTSNSPTAAAVPAMSMVIGHRWQLVSYSSEAGTVRVPDDARTMLDFVDDRTLQISTPDEGDRLHYVHGRSEFWSRSGYFSYATVSGAHARVRAD